MTRVMVTGGAGMIGIELCRQLSEAKHDVNLFDLTEQVKRIEIVLPSEVNVYHGSILDRSVLREAMSGCNIVIHLAAMLGVRRTESNLLRCLEINIDGTKRVLECAALEGIERIVFASSSEVYGEPAGNPITEEFPLSGDTVYAVSKAAAEKFCIGYAQGHSLDYTILRYFNSYGPHQVSQFVISRFISSVLRGEAPTINGDGQQCRSYTYCSDTANATVLAATKPEARNQVLNIGNGDRPISLSDLAKLVIDLAGQGNKLEPAYDLEFSNADRERSREIVNRYCDSSKARALLGWRPAVSLEEGIRLTLKYGMPYDSWDGPSIES